MINDLPFLAPLLGPGIGQKEFEGQTYVCFDDIEFQLGINWRISHRLLYSGKLESYIIAALFLPDSQNSEEESNEGAALTTRYFPIRELQCFLLRLHETFLLGSKKTLPNEFQHLASQILDNYFICTEFQGEQK